MNFNDYDWHDSVIKKIEIQRDEFREQDTITIEIEWYDNTFNMLVLENVYKAQFDMNFGIVGIEAIDEAYTSENDILLHDFYGKWNGLMDDIKLNCYVIKTSSTASELKIIAKGFKMA